MRVFSYGFTQKTLGITVVMLVLIASLIAITVTLFVHNLFSSIYIFIMVLIVGWFVKFAEPTVWAYMDGEDGEKIVRRELKKLPKAFYILHDFVDGKKGNIDFVVISPAGIWTIEVKYSNRAGEVTFNNGLLYINKSPLEGNDLNQSYAESIALQNHIREALELSLPVYPLLVFANRKNTMHFGTYAPKGVQVIGIGWLRKLLLEQKKDDRLTPELCNKLNEEVKKFTSLI